MLAGVEVPGYKLVQKRAYRKWAEDPAEQMAGLGLDPDAYSPRSVISPAQAEKVFGKTPAWNTLVELIVTPEGGVTIAPMEDPRQPVDRGSEFDVIIEE